jgi:sulfate/thiosulfate transport system permease protein
VSPTSNESWEFRLQAESHTAAERLPGAGIRLPGADTSLGLGVVTLYLSLIVLIPIAAVVDQSFSEGTANFWDQITSQGARKALTLTLTCSLIVVAINGVFGTLIAWVMVRDDFRGKALLNAVIDLPFALPTIVAGVTLLSLFISNDSPIGVNIGYTRWAVVLALLFVTFPFVVRAVQPVLLELDPEVEEAAASLGASGFTIFRRIIFPNILPGLLAGVALAFARALGEFGSVALIGATLNSTVASVYIRGLIEGDNFTGAAAVSMVLLLMSLVLVASVTLLQRWGSKHDR